MLRLTLALIATTLIASCVTESTVVTQPSALDQASVVTVAQPGFALPRNASLQWRSDIIWVDHPELRGSQFNHMLVQAFEQELQQQGFFISHGHGADYELLLVAVPGDLQDHPEVERVFNLYPSLVPNEEGYNTGNLLLAILPPNSQAIKWRGAIEIFTAFNSLSDSERQQRINSAARQLLSNLPRQSRNC